VTGHIAVDRRHVQFVNKPLSVNPRTGKLLPMNRGFAMPGLLPRVLGLLVLLTCNVGAAAQGPPAPPVTVSVPLSRQVTEWTEYTGQFAAVDYVEIRARVSGYLTELRFKDGQIVNKGDVLLVIDPRPYEIELQQAEAQRATAEAQLEYATRDVSRGAALRQNDFLAASTYDQRIQQMKTAAAALETAKAAMRQAQLDIEFSHVTAPVTGRISTHQVSVGNLVVGGTNATLLTSIVSIDPIWFNFDMSESDYLVFQRAISKGQLGAPRDAGTPAQARLDDEQDWPHVGKIDFVDNQVDRGSGTIRVRATFPNPDRFITPGQFGRLRLPASATHDALLIPDAAIITDQSRKVVMTVNAEGTVVPKVVQPGPMADGLRVIRSGLAADDRVVIDGLLRARPGGKVTPQAGQITPAQS
jgi:RND family efflux transporter MFP subunit